MSIETEVKAAEQAVEGEAKKVETEVKTEATNVAENLVGDTKKVLSEVEGKAKAATVEITAEEKLFLREAELEFLKGQMEIQRLSTLADAKRKEYQTYVEGLLKKYALSKVEYVFDAAANIFKKL